MRILIFCFLVFCSAITYCAEPHDKPLTLSLQEAILLSIRENPNVQQAQLNFVQQKFALEVQEWQFQLHYALTGNASISRTVTADDRLTSRNWGATPAVSLLTPIGTQVTLTSTDNVTNHFNPSLSVQIVQPLMRGYGRAIVEASLHNAMDSEIISRLNVEGALRNTITAVINAYLNVVSAENSVKIDQDALKRAEISVQQTRLFIKAGRKAGVELVTVQSDVANAQAKLENDKNNVDQMRYALLTAIGIDPNTKVVFTNLNVDKLIAKYLVPTLDDTKRRTLDNDIQYQVDQITLQGTTKRSLMIAEDNARWQLNLTTTGTMGGGGGGGQNAGFSSLVNGANQAQSVQLNLVVPIDDKLEQQAILNARIGLREAQVALKQERWAKETNAINGWNTIFSTERSMHFAEEAEKLQNQTYKISFQKYSFGLIDSVELQTVQQQLINRQQSLLDARINYFKALVALDQQVGHTLNTWDIRVRYSC